MMMKIKNEIEISSESEEYLKLLDDYERLDEFDELLSLDSLRLKGETFFHLYPVRDTLRQGKTTGYIQMLESRVVIYNADKKKIKFESRRLHDRIDLHVPAKISIFKDLSTMIEVAGDIVVELSQSIHVYYPLRGIF